jgi:hypothetical protein
MMYVELCALCGRGRSFVEKNTARAAAAPSPAHTAAFACRRRRRQENKKPHSHATMHITKGNNTIHMLLDLKVYIYTHKRRKLIPSFEKHRSAKAI